MNAPVKVTDSMGDHWVYHGVSVYLSRDGESMAAMYVVPALAGFVAANGDLPGYGFPTLDAAVDAIHTHLKGGADG